MLELKPNRQPEFSIAYTPYGHAPHIRSHHPYMPKRMVIRNHDSHALVPKKFKSHAEAEDFIRAAWPNKAERELASPEVVTFFDGLKFMSKWYAYWTQINHSTGEVDKSKPSYSDYLKTMAATKGEEEGFLCDDYDAEIPIAKPEAGDAQLQNQGC